MGGKTKFVHSKPHLSLKKIWVENQSFILWKVPVIFHFSQNHRNVCSISKHLFKRSTFMIDKRLLSKRFSEHAKTYDAYANVQKNMAKQLVDLLPQKNTNHKINILEIGCGTGYLTRL